jgi:predicted DNA-binding ribbon-helix-helix protein
MAKRSITIAGHHTSVSIEEPFWQALGEIAAAKRLSLAAVIGEIDRERTPGTNLSSAIRLAVLKWYREMADGGGG